VSALSSESVLVRYCVGLVVAPEEVEADLGEMPHDTLASVSYHDQIGGGMLHDTLAWVDQIGGRDSR